MSPELRERILEYNRRKQRDTERAAVADQVEQLLRGLSGKPTLKTLLTFLGQLREIFGHGEGN